MRAAPFTAENAAEMARRSWEARRKRAADEAEEAKRIALLPESQEDDARKKRVIAQLARCDELLEDCKADDFPALTAAKERLWRLIFPTVSPTKQRSNGSARRSMPVPTPVQTQTHSTNPVEQH